MVVDRRVLGAVLAGGASRRMGSDKSLIELAGVPFIVRVADALRAGGCDPVVTVGGEQERLTSLGLEVRADRTPGAGPLDGVIRALEAAGGSPAMVVACDMPWLSATLVGALVDALRRSSGALDVVVARGERLEPLCAVWAPSALPVLVAAFDDGERAVHRTFDRLRVGEVAVGADEVRNVNTPADLADVLRGEGTSGG